MRMVSPGLRAVAGVTAVCGITMVGVAACGSTAPSHPASGATSATSATSTTGATSHPATATSQATATSPAAADSAAASQFASMTADQIAAKAISDFKNASSVHLTGSVSASGHQVSLSVSIGRQDCTGTFTLQGAGAVRFVKAGNALWVMPDGQFLETRAALQPSAPEPPPGKYLTANVSSVQSFCDLTSLANGFTSRNDRMVKGAMSQIDGQRVIALPDATDGSVGYVTVSAVPEIARVAKKGQGGMSFTGYNTPVTATPPAAGQTADGAKYGF
jgi:hypothetical protein